MENPQHLPCAIFWTTAGLWPRKFIPVPKDNRVCCTLANLVLSLVVLGVDVVDTVLDFSFARKVINGDDPDGPFWGRALLAGTCISVIINFLSFITTLALQVMMKDVATSLIITVSYVVELLMFVSEDATMVMLILNVDGAYDPTNTLDIATVAFSLASGTIAIFVVAPLAIAQECHEGYFENTLVSIVTSFCPLTFIALMIKLLVNGELVINGVHANNWVNMVYLMYTVVVLGLLFVFFVLIPLCFCCGVVCCNDDEDDEDNFGSFENAVIVLQRKWRQHYATMNESAIVIEKTWRGHRTKLAVEDMTRATIAIQRVWREHRFKAKPTRTVDNAQTSPTEHQMSSKMQ